MNDGLILSQLWKNTEDKQSKNLIITFLNNINSLW